MRKKRALSVLVIAIAASALVIGCAVFYDTYCFTHNEFGTVTVIGEPLGTNLSDIQKEEIIRAVVSWAEEQKAMVLHRDYSVVCVSVADYSGRLAINGGNSVYVCSDKNVTKAYVNEGRFIPIDNDVTIIYYNAESLPNYFRIYEFLIPLNWNRWVTGTYDTDGDVRSLYDLFVSYGLQARMTDNRSGSLSDAFRKAKNDEWFSGSILGLLVALGLCLVYSYTLLYDNVFEYVSIHFLFGQKHRDCWIRGMIQSILIVFLCTCAAFLMLQSLLPLYSTNELLKPVTAGAVTSFLFLGVGNGIGFVLVCRSMKEAKI